MGETSPTVGGMQWDRATTIEAEFGRVWRALSGGVYALGVNYDESLGYPKVIFTDRVEGTLDDERKTEIYDVEIVHVG
jgi:hypothetical protein